MSRRRLVIAGLLALIVMVAFMIWLDKTSGRTNGQASSHGAAAAESSPAPGAGSSIASGLDAYDGGPIARTIADRRVRDELRRRILAGWAQGEGETAAAAKEGRMQPMPTGSDGRIDPQYIKDVVRADLMPMVKKCYEELSVRKPGAEGRISMTFKIVGDDKLGAIVDETGLAADAGALADDERFTTCVRESTMSLAFRPLPHDGTAVVPLSIVFEDRDR